MLKTTTKKKTKKKKELEVTGTELSDRIAPRSTNGDRIDRASRPGYINVQGQGFYFLARHREIVSLIIKCYG
jgi:hypothetical protein